MILGSIILPHQPVLLDPFKPGAPEGVEELSRCCDVAVDVLAKWEPDVVVLVSPHGISSEKSPRPGIYLTPSGRGSYQQKGGDGESFEVKVQFDYGIAAGFLDHMGMNEIPCVKVTGKEAPLDEHAVVPLWFLRNIPYTEHHPKFVFLTVPNSGEGGSSIARSKNARESVKPMIVFGRHMHRYFSQLNSRVAFVFLGDLAHTHATHCTDAAFLPDDEHRLPANDVAAVFDAMIEKWAFTFRDDIICSDAAALAPKAISCGFDTMLALHGMITRDGRTKYSKHVLSRHRPTSIGMMVAVFQADKRVPKPDYVFDFS